MLKIKPCDKNAIETFSTYFVQKVADKDVAFRSVGKSYCGTMEELSYIISLGRNEKRKKHFNHKVELYKVWKSRLEENDLKIQRASLEGVLRSKISQLDEKKKSEA